MFKKHPDKTLLYTVVACTAVIALSLLYVGYGLTKDKPMTDDEFYAKVNDGIQRFIDAEEKKYQEELAQQNTEAPQDLQKVEGVGIDDDDIKGDVNAPITIIEFSDYECPFCKTFYEDTLPQLQEEYIDTGLVKFVYRDLPLEMLHANAFKLAIAAECAGEQGKYYDMHDAIFEYNGAFSTDAIKELAGLVDVNQSTFDTCLDNESTRAEVEKDMQDASEFGVQGTPAFFINGYFLSGARPFEDFQNIIDQELQKIQ